MDLLERLMRPLQGLSYDNDVSLFLWKLEVKIQVVGLKYLYD